MSDNLTKWSWERAILESDLSSSARLVALVINAHASAAGGGAYPGRVTIARKAGIKSTVTVTKALKELEDAGFIVVTRRNGGSQRLTNSYELVIPKAQNPDTQNCSVQNMNTHRLSPKQTSKPNRPVEPNKPVRTLGTQPTAAHREGSSLDYSEAFEAAWPDYPKRQGPNNKKSAYKQWNARLREGFTESQLHAGIVAYNAFITATDRVGTRFVLHAATFLGADHRFNDDWSANTPTTGDSAAAQSWDEILTWIKANGRYSNNKWPYPHDAPITRAVHSIGGVASLRSATDRDLPFKRREFLKAMAA